MRHIVESYKEWTKDDFCKWHFTIYDDITNKIYYKITIDKERSKLK